MVVARRLATYCIKVQTAACSLISSPPHPVPAGAYHPARELLVPRGREGGERGPERDQVPRCCALREGQLRGCDHQQLRAG
jgi:hypothetical protein